MRILRLPRALPRVALASCACAFVAACGGSAQSASSAPRASSAAVPEAGAAQRRLMDWPEFGLDPQRSDSSEAATGITSADVSHLHHSTVALAGTVDSSPAYLHGALVDGAMHNV